MRWCAVISLVLVFGLRLVVTPMIRRLLCGVTRLSVMRLWMVCSIGWMLVMRCVVIRLGLLVCGRLIRLCVTGLRCVRWCLLRPGLVAR